MKKKYLIVTILTITTMMIISLINCSNPSATATTTTIADASGTSATESIDLGVAGTAVVTKTKDISLQNDYWLKFTTGTVSSSDVWYVTTSWENTYKNQANMEFFKSDYTTTISGTAAVSPYFSQYDITASSGQRGDIGILHNLESNSTYYIKMSRTDTSITDSLAGQFGLSFLPSSIVTNETEANNDVSTANNASSSPAGCLIAAYKGSVTTSDVDCIKFNSGNYTQFFVKVLFSGNGSSDIANIELWNGDGSGVVLGTLNSSLSTGESGQIGGSKTFTINTNYLLKVIQTGGTGNYHLLVFGYK